MMGLALWFLNIYAVIERNVDEGMTKIQQFSNM